MLNSALPDTKALRMTTRGLLVSKDLFFASKITGTAGALGGSVIMAASQQGALDRLAEGPCSVVIVDLQCTGLDLPALCQAAGATPVVAFGPHVAIEAFAAAEAAGCQEVLPRSRFTAQLPQLLTGWLGLNGEVEG